VTPTVLASSPSPVVVGPLAHETGLARSSCFARLASAGARFEAVAGRLVARDFGDAIGEYFATRERVGLSDASRRSACELVGPDAGRLLDATATREVSALPPGKGAVACLCDERGLLVDVVGVFRLAAERFLVRSNTAEAASWLASHAADHLLDVGVGRLEEAESLALHGPRSATVLARATGLDELARALPGPPGWSLAVREVALTPTLRAFVTRHGDAASPSYVLDWPRSDVDRLWDRLVEVGVPEGLRLVGTRAIQARRLERGIPTPGVDFGRATDPFEAGLGWAVSLASRSLVGAAALVARRESPRRRIVWLAFDDGIPPVASTVVADGREVGIVTSAVFSPAEARALAFAMVDVAATAPGQTVRAHAAGAPLCGVVLDGDRASLWRHGWGGGT
jgi:aminomethyltransferase